VGLREVDNPVVVFERLAKESGAESFFPTSERDFKKTLDRIATLLNAQYVLAYYPERVDKVRKIKVKVDRAGVKISARGTVGSENPTQAVHFAATGCEVSPKDHPYPWESRITSRSGSPMVYHEDFSDARSGWPNRSYENMHSNAHYNDRGYVLTRNCPRCTFSPRTVPGIVAAAGDAVIAAYGPWWHNFRASVSLEAFWYVADAGVGVAFDVREENFYAFLVGWQNSFALVKGSWDGKRTPIIPPTPLGFSIEKGGKPCKLTVDRNLSHITLYVNDRQVGTVEDPSFENGLVGLGVFGSGQAVVYDLLVEATP
jgi:hypothetical protein